jgi:hypothetical protein
MARDKEKHKATKRKYYEEHKEKIVEYRRIYNSDPSHKARHNEKQKEWARNNAEKVRESNRKRYNPEDDRKRKLKRYGITPDDYNFMFDAQNGYCAICGIHQSKLKKPLFVDHDHKKNKVRGLICHRCNFAIGLFDDSIDNLLNAIKYLKGE